MSEQLNHDRLAQLVGQRKNDKETILVLVCASTNNSFEVVPHNMRNLNTSDGPAPAIHTQYNHLMYTPECNTKNRSQIGKMTLIPTSQLESQISIQFGNAQHRYGTGEGSIHCHPSFKPFLNDSSPQLPPQTCTCQKLGTCAVNARKTRRDQISRC